jgi:hypothetical protein
MEVHRLQESREALEKLDLSRLKVVLKQTTQSISVGQADTNGSTPEITLPK